MNGNKKIVSTRASGMREYCGIGNIIIPRDIDRASYIERCFRTGTVSMAFENGGKIDDVLCSRAALHDVGFPDSYKGLGAQVVWINKPKQNQPIIIGVFNKNNEFVNFGQYKDSLRKSSERGVAEVTVDSDKGVVIINSSSVGDTGGDIYIISTNKQKSSKLTVRVSGSVDVETPDFSITGTDKISFIVTDPAVDDTVSSLTYEKGVGLTYKDEFNNEWYINKDNFQIKAAKFIIGDGNEPMILGASLKSFLNSLIDQIAAITVTASGSPTTIPINAPAINALKGQLDSLLSNKSSTD